VAISIKVAISVRVTISMSVAINHTIHVWDSRHLRIIKLKAFKNGKDAILVVEVVMNCMRQLLSRTVPIQEE